MPTSTATLYPFAGVVQHYAWGGREFLPRFLRRDNPDGEPWAELWMGAHAKGPARLLDRSDTLDELIHSAPVDLLGAEVARRFRQRLPFLFKVLDVRDMLSIQVHPTKAAAEEGFRREEESGPARDAPDRNYRDDNHKPELGVAVTDFYLLHGFRDAAAIAASLDEIPGWSSLAPAFEKGGVKGLYAHVMNAGQEEIDRLLQPLVDELEQGTYDRSQPRFWAKRGVEQYTTDGHHDRGLFSIFWFNLVHLRPGEGIFQDAGIPHAYLEGVCIELMANSDNVLRGGLTPKHIDVPELLDNTRFEAVTPAILNPQGHPDHPWRHYPTPAPDFALDFIAPTTETTLSIQTQNGPAILLLMEGEASLGSVKLSEAQRTVFLPAGQQYDARFAAGSKVYRARV